MGAAAGTTAAGTTASGTTAARATAETSLPSPGLALPARIVPPRERPAAMRLVAAVVRNPLEAWPEAVYRDPVYRSTFLGRETVFVMAPALVRGVLVEQSDAFAKADALRRALGPALGEAILVSDGARWRRQRRAAAPVFRHERVLAFAPAMRGAARRARDRLLRGAEADDAPVDVPGAMMRATFDIIVETMMSGRGAIDVDRVEAAVTAYLDSTSWRVALAMFGAPDWTPFPGKRRADRAGAYLRVELERLVAQARRPVAAARATPIGLGGPEAEREDLLALLLRAHELRDGEGPPSGEAMGDRDVVDNLLTFVAAGHETTALALAWTLYLLALHPEAEARALAEIAAAGETAFGPEQGAALPYTRAVLQEAMRLYPPAPVIARRALRAVELRDPGGDPGAPGGVPVRVAAGSPTYVPVYAIHRHRALWDEPDAFRPERFLPAAPPPQRGAYLPFGAGPRTCIGLGFALLEAGIILAEILPALRFAPPAVPPHPRLRVTLRPASLAMRVARRTTSP